MGNTKRNKTNDAGTDANLKSGNKKKGRGGMRDKQEDNKNKNLEDIDYSPAWGGKDEEIDPTREADGVAESSKEPVESIQTTEKQQDEVVTEPTQSNYLQDEPLQQEPAIAEIEFPSTTTPAPMETKAQEKSDHVAIPDDGESKNQASVTEWSFDREEALDAAKSTVVAKSPVVATAPDAVKIPDGVKPLNLTKASDVATDSEVARPPAVVETIAIAMSPDVAKPPAILEVSDFAKSPNVATSPAVTKIPAVTKSPVVVKSLEITGTQDVVKTLEVAKAPEVFKVPKVANSQDVVDSQDDLGDELQQLSLGVHSSQEDVTMTKNERKKDVAVSAGNVMCESEVEDSTVTAKLSSGDSPVSPTSPKPYQKPSPLSSNQQPYEPERTTRILSSKVRASTELTAQEPQLSYRPVPPLQEVFKQPTTVRPVPDQPQLPSKSQNSIQVQDTETQSPTDLQLPLKSKTSTRNQSTQKEASTQSQLPSKPQNSIRPQPTQIQAPIQSPLLLKPKVSIRDQSTQTQGSIQSHLPIKPKTPTRNQSIQTQALPEPKLQGNVKNPTRDQGTQTEPWPEALSPAKPKIFVRDQGNQTPVPISSVPEPSLQGIQKPCCATPLASTELHNEENESFHGQREPQPYSTSSTANVPAQRTPIVGPSVSTSQVQSESTPQNPPRSNSLQSHPVRPDTVQPMPIAPLPPTLRPASQALLSSTGPVLKLIVNYNTNDVVINQKHILARNTSYFRRHTHRDPEFGQYVNFKGEQFCHEVIKEYSLWLDRGVIPTMAALGRITPSTAALTLNFLAHAYVLGERIKDTRWMNEVMDALIHVHILDWCFDMDDVIYYTYEYTKHGSRLCKFLVDMQAYCLLPGDRPQERFRDLPSEFAFNILCRLEDVGSYGRSDWRGRLNDPRRYHV